MIQCWEDCIKQILGDDGPPSVARTWAPGSLTSPSLNEGREARDTAQWLKHHCSHRGSQLGSQPQQHIIPDHLSVQFQGIQHPFVDSAGTYHTNIYSDTDTYTHKKKNLKSQIWWSVIEKDTWCQSLHPFVYISNCTHMHAPPKRYKSNLKEPERQFSVKSHFAIKPLTWIWFLGPTRGLGENLTLTSCPSVFTYVPCAHTHANIHTIKCSVTIFSKKEGKEGRRKGKRTRNRIKNV